MLPPPYESSTKAVIPPKDQFERAWLTDDDPNPSVFVRAPRANELHLVREAVADAFAISYTPNFWREYPSHFHILISYVEDDHPMLKDIQPRLVVRHDDPRAVLKSAFSSETFTAKWDEPFSRAFTPLFLPDGSVMIGFTMYGIYEEGTLTQQTVPNLRDKITAYIIGIAVARGCKSLGIGRKMLQQTVYRAWHGENPIATISLHVDVLNEKGLGFYTSLGFTTLKSFSSYYRINHLSRDAFFLILSLKYGFNNSSSPFTSCCPPPLSLFASSHTPVQHSRHRPSGSCTVL